MPRRPFISAGGIAYHVLNAAVTRERIFGDDDDYLAGERIVERTFGRLRMRTVSYRLMPNHALLVSGALAERTVRERRQREL